MSQPVTNYGPSAPSAPTEPSTPTPQVRPQKSFIVTWLLALLLGTFGADRFYLGKIGTAVLKLVTFGGLGIWTLIDLILVLTGNTKDKSGQALAGYDKSKKIALIVTAAWIVLGGISGAAIGAGAAATIASIPGTVDDGLGDPAEAPVVEAPAETAEAEAPADEPATADDPATANDPAAETIAWAEDAYGTFSSTSETGSGDSVITLPAGATAGLVRASHDGSANFSLQVLDADNQPTLDLLVNTIGAYRGITAYGLNGALGTPGVTIKVTADGPWQIDLGPISYAGELEAAGIGDNIFLYGGSAATLALTHDGSANFTVLEYSDSGMGMGLLVNEIGAYQGSVPVSAGPAVIRVGADGNWTVAQG